jgi:hypothetical protein
MKATTAETTYVIGYSSPRNASWMGSQGPESVLTLVMSSSSWEVTPRTELESRQVSASHLPTEQLVD